MSSSSEHAPRIAVVGAGLAGLVAADRLAIAGADVTVIDKARGPGGRAATRRHEAWRFDHGMQYFTARSEAFRRQVDEWCDAGVVARWSPRLEGGDASPAPDPGGSLPDVGGGSGASANERPSRELKGGPAGGLARDRAGGDASGAEDATPPSARAAPPDAWFVGVPGSNAPCQSLASSGRFTLRASLRVDHIEPTTDGPRVRIDRNVGVPGAARTPPDPTVAGSLEAATFDAVLVTAPAPQIGSLLKDAPELADLVRFTSDVRLAPCWALMLGFARPVDVPWDVRRRSDGPLSWMARDAAKPGRPGPADGPGEAWVVHAAPDWSAEHVELDHETAADRLRDEALAAFRDAGARPGEPLVAMAHRWRYALVTEPAGEPFRWNPGTGVGVAGDWAVAGRFESAFTSGRALAAAVAATFGRSFDD